MNSDDGYLEAQLNWARFYLHAEIDRQAENALLFVAKHVSHCRRSIAQRFRKIQRDLDHDQNSH
jgi:hypothetical protein